jgi:uncharacterized protein
MVTPGSPQPVSRVTWAPIPGKGRGVIALEACAAGSEVERAPVIVVPADDLHFRPGNPTVLEQYLLYWSDEPGAELCMGEGMLMMYNHSPTPNVEFHTGPEPLTMSVIAVRDIAAGEELVYDYDCELWFEPG